MEKKTLSLFILTLLLIGTLRLEFYTQPAKAEATIWTVDDDGPADFHTIQDAINAASHVRMLAASSEDIILVASGVYYEHISLGTVSLIGEDPDTTIIDGNGTGIVVYLGPWAAGANVTGVTIRNGDYGVKIDGGIGPMPEYVGAVLNGNRIVDNNYGGVHLEHCSGCLITNNVIANNPLFGLHLDSSGNNTIINNAVMNNGHGIDFYANSNNNILRNNTMTDNEYNFGLVWRGITRNWITGNPPTRGIVNDVDTSNTVNGKPIYYWINRHNEQVPEDAGYVWLNDCSNITVEGLSISNNLQGILLTFTNNTSIVDNNITSNVCGIYISVFSYNNTIIGNTLEDNLRGIYLADLSWFTTMRDNSISGGQMNFGVSPDIPRFMGAEDLVNDVDTSNTVDGKPIVYWINQHDQQVPKNAGYVMLINCTNILIEGLNLSNNAQNIIILASNNTVISNNSITNSLYGIDVRGYRAWGYFRYYSFNTTVKGNTLIDNAVGLRLSSNNSLISNNTLYRNPLGFYLKDTSHSTISGNVVVASDFFARGPDYEFWIFYHPEFPWERSREIVDLESGGIVAGGTYNVVCDNTVMNSYWGISMVGARGRLLGEENVIFHNNLINNYMQTVEPPEGPNYWDDGYPSGGNYYSDNAGVDEFGGSNQDQPGSDGIGDTPYGIKWLNYDIVTEDRYPLMNPVPWTSPLPSWMEVGVATGDWIKYDYTITGASPETPLPQWMKVEFTNVVGTIATIQAIMHMSNGTEQNETMTFDLIAGNGTLGTFSGLVIPANSAAGDFAYMSGLGNAIIIDETTGIYARANRKAVYTSISAYLKLTYYWDKQTGVMVEASAIYGNMTVTAKATDTNMWQTHGPLLGDFNDDGKVDISDVVIAGKAFASYPGHPRWDSRADMNTDNVVDIFDLLLIVKNFGKTA